LYSRYPIYEAEEPDSRSHSRTRSRVPEPERHPARDEHPRNPPNQGILGSLGEGIGGFLKNLKLDWDSGDILLILIILFLSTESDDTEILILLALLLIM
jgi:hypothetical protein